MNDKMAMNEPVLACRGLYKTFSDGHLHVDVLAGVDLSIKSAERIAIVGASGSGKSTLLHLLGGLDRPSQGSIDIMGQRIDTLGEVALGRFRNINLGFIYQFHHLLPEFTALENVALPLMLGKHSATAAQAQAQSILVKVGLGERLQHKPGELSGGERQRAAVARALVTEPKCVLADEPTGNLDFKTADQVYSIMLELNADLDTSFVVVTHDRNLAKRMDRVLTLEGGKVREEA